MAVLTFTRAAGGRINLPTTNIGQLGSSFTIQGPSALPHLNISGFFTAGGALAGPVTTSDFYSLRDMVSMTKGKHNLVYGGEFGLDKGMFAANLDNFGIFTFSSSAPTTTGNALSDFVTGQVNTMEQDTPYHTLMSAWHTAVFLQDNFRITPRFTANLGVRWDIDTPPVESSNLTAAFVPGQQSTVVPSAPLGMLFPGDKGVTRGIVTTKVSPCCAAHRLCVGSVRRRQDRHSRGRRHLLRDHQRQRVEPAGQRTTLRDPADVQLDHFADQCLRESGVVPQRRSVPVHLQPEEPALPCAGQHRVHRTERAVAVYLPVQPGGGEAIAGTVEPDNGLRGHAVARFAYDDRRQLRALCARERATSQASINARRPLRSRRSGPEHLPDLQSNRLLPLAADLGKPAADA